MLHPMMIAVCLVVLLTASGFAADIPPDADGAKAALDKSPRHGEWVDVKLPESDKSVRSYIVYPERSDKAPVVLVIHEIFGLSDWVRGVADQLAADGFIAIAPDLLTGMGPGGGGTDAFKSRDDVVKAVRELDDQTVDSALRAVLDYAMKQPSSNGQAATVGFCWGGSQSFRFATVPDNRLAAAVVYYGTPPGDAALVKLGVPVLGLYGGDDNRVTSTVRETAAKAEAMGKRYEPHVYEGAGHGFLRQQSERQNKQASEQAWPTTMEFLKKQTGKQG